MESEKITSTNLSILRQILEGTYVERLESLNHSKTDGNNNAIADCDGNDKIRSKKKRKPKESNFMLNSDDEFIRDWLHHKRKLQRENRRALAKERKEERMKNNLRNKEKQERLLLARESYDRWLINIRKRSPEKPTKEIQEESVNKERLEAAGLAYKVWLNSKRAQDHHGSAQHASSVLQQQQNAINMENKVLGEQLLQIRVAKSRSLVKAHCDVAVNRNLLPRPKTVNSEPVEGPLDDDCQQLVQGLRQKNRLRKAQSLKRVDSGLVTLNTEPKVESSISTANPKDHFQWKLAIPENSDAEFQRDKPHSNSRHARKLEQITHVHDNPFSDNVIRKRTEER